MARDKDNDGRSPALLQGVVRVPRIARPGQMNHTRHAFADHLHASLEGQLARAGIYIVRWDMPADASMRPGARWTVAAASRAGASLEIECRVKRLLLRPSVIAFVVRAAPHRSSADHQTGP
ncbi:MAG: hypothetical protein WBD40_03305 [Tepidisphaeraceae bacterium]